MNNKYLIERENLITEHHNLSRNISNLNAFIAKYEKCFKEEPSIEALKTIKDYIIVEQDKYNNLENSIRDIHDKIRNSCTHDVLINDNNVFKCPVCGKRFDYENINFNCLMVEKDDSVDWQTYDLVRNIIYDICRNNEDIVDTFHTHIDGEKIRIYRR